MRREMRVALERFLRGYWEGNNKPQTRDEHIGHRAGLAFNLYHDIQDLGGLDAALADDPTDNAPGLAAVVAAQGVALEALGQQVRTLEAKTRRRFQALEAQVRLLEGDLKRAEDALMDVACERSAPVSTPPANPGGYVAPEQPIGPECFGGSDYPAYQQPAPLEEEWLVEPVPVTIRALPGALIPHVSMVRWDSGDAWPARWCALFPASHGCMPIRVRDGERVGVRPGGRLEVVS